MTRSELIALVPNKPYRMPCCRECIGKSKKDCDENPLNCIDFYLLNKETIDKLSLKALKDGEDNARYIDVEKVHIPKGFFKDLNVPKLLDWLKSQPTADVVEVKHGYWIGLHNTGQYDDWKCSHCGKFEDTRNKNNCGDYCKWCGAKMDLKEGVNI